MVTVVILMVFTDIDVVLIVPGRRVLTPAQTGITSLSEIGGADRLWNVPTLLNSW